MIRVWCVAVGLVGLVGCANSSLAELANESPEEEEIVDIPCSYPTGQLAEDTDADGVCDGDDLCPGHGDEHDADEDGLPDGCDTCEGDDSLDDDDDGVPDDCDQCPGFKDYIDIDNDGVPDDCDDCPGDPLNDADGDDICDSDDPCLDDANNECLHPATLQMTTDYFPTEMSWELWLESIQVASANGAALNFQANTDYQMSLELVPANYTLWMYDSYGDGWATTAQIGIMSDCGAGLLVLSQGPDPTSGTGDGYLLTVDFEVPPCN